jgi:aminobenzoyl-glutamate utilization protein B
MQNSDNIWKLVEEKAPVFAELSDRVWGTPELAFQENQSAQAHLELLRGEGFRVETGQAGMPTAVMGEAGEGGPVIAILGEFDALPGLSQKENLVCQAPIQSDGNGHGCGHNMLGAGSMLAATAVKDWLAATGTRGRVRYYACPAEESGSGKGFMVRAGVFDDTDIAICWHPADFTGVNPPRSLACVEMEFSFSGRSSHAAVAPHLGRSALDAVELMNIGVNYMREHMPASARVHYAILDSGGTAPNVVPSKARSRYMVRAAALAEMWQLVERVKGIAEGAARMSETSVSCRLLAGDANLVGNNVLETVMNAVIARLGGPQFDDTDKVFAAQLQKTFGQDAITSAYKRFGLPPKQGEALSETVFPLLEHHDGSVGSTDVGTVSWVVPTVQCRTACYAIGTPGHSWQLVAQGKAPAAHKGLTHAAKIMAATAVDLLRDNQLVTSAKNEHMAFRSVNEFTNPIGPDLELDIEMALGVG